MKTIKITSCMAPNADIICQAIAGYLSQQLACQVEFINNIPWQEREALFDAGEIAICWICGLPYIWKMANHPTAIRLLCAPVMNAPRYQDRPIYFSDVVVRQDSPFQQFSDLAEKRWAYNEPNSHSGYYLVRYYLAKLGLNGNFFSQVAAAGSHQNALAMLLAGEIDACAIDSTVLETELRQQSQLSDEIRVIETLGPSPMPPWITNYQLPLPLLENIEDLLLNLHLDPMGKAILVEAGWARLEKVWDEDYNPIREMADQAIKVTL